MFDNKYWLICWRYQFSDTFLCCCFITWHHVYTRSVHYAYAWALRYDIRPIGLSVSVIPWDLLVVWMVSFSLSGHINFNFSRCTSRDHDRFLIFRRTLRWKLTVRYSNKYSFWHLVRGGSIKLKMGGLHNGPLSSH